MIINKEQQQIRAANELFSVKRKQLSSPPRDDQNINTRSSAINRTNPINQSTVYKSGLWKLLLGSQFKHQSTWWNKMVEMENHAQFMR